MSLADPRVRLSELPGTPADRCTIRSHFIPPRDRVLSSVPIPAMVFAFAAGVVVGCAEPPPRPVAAARLTVDRFNVPVGGPLELNLRFDTVHHLEPLLEDYRVAVRFLNSDGLSLWTDDHDPAVPTSRWEPGQTIEYSRSVTLPPYPYLGTLTLAVGLYSPESGETLPLAGEDLDQAARGVPTIETRPRHESSVLVHETGWHPVEFDEAGGRDWRWTTGRAVIAFRNPHDDIRLILEVAGRPDLFEEPQRLSLVIGDRSLHERVLDTNLPVSIDETVPVADLGRDEVVRLELRVDKTFVPAELDGSRDTRELGMRVFFNYVEPI